MENNTNPTCQICNEAVVWSHKPADVSWPAFVHANTNHTNCNKEN